MFFFLRPPIQSVWFLVTSGSEGPIPRLSSVSQAPFWPPPLGRPPLAVFQSEPGGTAASLTLPSSSPATALPSAGFVAASPSSSLLFTVPSPSHQLTCHRHLLAQGLLVFLCEPLFLPPDAQSGSWSQLFSCKSPGVTPLLKALQWLAVLSGPKVNAWTGLERPYMTWPQLLLFSLTSQS